LDTFLKKPSKWAVTPILAALSAIASAQAPVKCPDVWIGPPGVEKGKALRAIFEHPDEWKQTRSIGERDPVHHQQPEAVLR
jgi:hypothetical protein